MAAVNGIRLHYVSDGDGPPVMLLHGWPQTWYCWRKVMPLLAERHTVIAPDLRGYGHSDKPPGGYDKRTMAEDVRALARLLGHERLALVGHDRGARVAHRWALDHPDEVERLAVLDIIPTRAMFRAMDAGRTTARRWRRRSGSTCARSQPRVRCGPASTTTAPPARTTWMPTTPAPRPASG
jgi:pimeloyl-ACP methyl ester carboxylesterase